MLATRLLQGELLSVIHRCLSPALPEAQPMQLATALWSYAAVGAEAGWVDELLQQVWPARGDGLGSKASPRGRHCVAGGVGNKLGIRFQPVLAHLPD